MILLTNGQVFGGEDGPPVIFKQVLLRGDRIAAIGNDLGLNSNEIKTIDLNGAWVFPGLCDAHLHMTAGGQSLGITDLAGLDLSGIEQAIQSAFSISQGDGSRWQEAFNWDENETCRLDARLLERLVPGHPIIVHKRDLHGCCCNETALRLVGITAQSVDPEGGSIGRKRDGSPNGMLYESAIGLIHRVKPAPDKSVRRKFILSAQDYFIQLGLTGISEILDRDNDEIYHELEKCGELKIDIDAWLRYENWDGISKPVSGDRFRVETLKLFLDGSFGSRTAAMLSAFNDGTDSGNLIYSDDDLRGVLNKAADRGWRVAIHAIGDKAVDQICRLLGELPVSSSGFARIEHLQQLPHDGINLVKRSRALASMQPIHLLDDQKWLPALIGKERCKNSFIWKSLYDNGVPIAIGSDWPVASPDPLLGIHAAINRAKYYELPDSGFDVGEALEPWQAIRSATRGYAVASHRTHERGTITVGKNADLTVVNHPDSSLRDWSGASLKMTISRGEILYSKN